jgi:hypothetical protein
VGVLPQLDGLVIPSPKGSFFSMTLFDPLFSGFDLAACETKVVIDDQRLEFVGQFDQAFINARANPGARKYGVLFSGPNGCLFLLLLISLLSQGLESLQLVFCHSSINLPNRDQLSTSPLANGGFATALILTIFQNLPKLPTTSLTNSSFKMLILSNPLDPSSIYFDRCSTTNLLISIRTLLLRML